MPALWQESTADADFLRRFELLVGESAGGAWMKTREGRFLALSQPFAKKLRVAAQDAGRVVDRDLFSPDEVRRFRRDDDHVLTTGRPSVYLEPPDSLSPAAWWATLKIPVRGEPDSAGATLAFSHPLDLLEPLLDLVADEGRYGRGLSGTSASRRVQAQLDDLFRERLRVSDIARALDLHPDHLARSFRLSYGVTIARYLTAKRVAWAARHLVESARPIAEIALAAGFYDQSHLTRALRQVLGTTPARYRRQARARADNALRNAELVLELCGSRRSPGQSRHTAPAKS